MNNTRNISVTGVRFLRETLRALRRVVCGSLTGIIVISGLAAEPPSYNRDIRPLLSDKCFHCHGPDQKTRKGKFRLDVREDAIAKGAIIPGNPDESEFLSRINTDNPEEVMPPPETHKALTSAQKELLREWVAAGAKYEKHWAYVPPAKCSTPADTHSIDALVRARLQRLGLQQSPPADRRTLARRLYFDLIGLPPSPEAVEKFISDKSPDAIAHLIDELLAAPQFGERMAIGWLDVVRFADTIGYHSDNPRNVWPYRDYVIKAFNQNLPFDRFTREQLAGDLLPDHTTEQQVASAFNRLLLSTEEGGAQPKDYEARMLTDRVRAVGAVWLGQTIGCAQCHDHKFDPITMRDFYSLGAFFADINEPIIGRRERGLSLADVTQQAELLRLTNVIEEIQKEFDAPHPAWDCAFAEWQQSQGKAAQQEGAWQVLRPSSATAASTTKLRVEKDDFILARSESTAAETYTVTFTNITHDAVGIRLEVLPQSSTPTKKAQRSASGNFVLSEISARSVNPNGVTRPIPFGTARADAGKSAAATIDGIVADGAKGWALGELADQPHQLVLAFAQPLALSAGDRLVIELRQGPPASALARFRFAITTNSLALQGPLLPAPPKEVAAILRLPTAERTAKQREELYANWRSTAPETATMRARLAAARRARDDYDEAIPHCLVSSTNSQPRVVRILPRGNFLNETGDIVQPALPTYLGGSVRTNGARLTRLDLANWLVARENPLTARVVVNRLWKQFFGLGLSRVVDDLGAQGELPPNQELLDWLACEFMDSGWDMRHMVRLIVTSATYQQSSLATPELRARDPLNRELAVQSRWRLDAELVRDNALAVSSLLVDRIGGPSVKPYQPDGYWENLNFPVRSYETSRGDDQYRRGLYVWWQRSYLHPSLLAFDAPSREECAAERNRSNIPQQALVLLNDPTYLEASRALALRVLSEGGRREKSRITWAWQQVLARPPRADEMQTIELLLSRQLATYRKSPAAAGAFLRIGDATAPDGVDPAELAAWTQVTRVLLNLHETITRS